MSTEKLSHKEMHIVHEIRDALAKEIQLSTDGSAAYRLLSHAPKGQTIEQEKHAQAIGLQEMKANQKISDGMDKILNEHKVSEASKKRISQEIWREMESITDAKVKAHSVKGKHNDVSHLPSQTGHDHHIFPNKPNSAPNKPPAQR